MKTEKMQMVARKSRHFFLLGFKDFTCFCGVVVGCMVMWWCGGRLNGDADGVVVDWMVMMK